MHVKVTDPHGRVVTGLKQQAFRRLVDGAKQEITVFQGEDGPVVAGIVNSTTAPAWRRSVRLGLRPPRNLRPTATLLTRSLCLHFNNLVRLGRALGEPFTYQIEELKAAISKFDLGGTVRRPDQRDESPERSEIQQADLAGAH
jgi:hypothetical protein